MMGAVTVSYTHLIGGNVHGGVEAEGYVGTIDIVINGLGQADDVQTLLREQVCGFVGAIAAQAQPVSYTHLRWCAE